MATHSSVLAWRISGTGEPGGLPPMGLHRVGHDWSDLAAAAAAGCIAFFPAKSNFPTSVHTLIGNSSTRSVIGFDILAWMPWLMYTGQNIFFLFDLPYLAFAASQILATLMWSYTGSMQYISALLGRGRAKGLGGWALVRKRGRDVSFL